MKRQNKKPIHTLKSTFVIIKAEGSPEFINQALKGVAKALKEKTAPPTPTAEAPKTGQASRL